MTSDPHFGIYTYHYAWGHGKYAYVVCALFSFLQHNTPTRLTTTLFSWQQVTAEQHQHQKIFITKRKGFGKVSPKNAIIIITIINSHYYCYYY